jgi:paired amphipathic helix protein Sin3a
MAGSYSPSNRVMGGGLYGQPPAQSQLQDHHYDYQSQQEQQASATAAALHQQEQRGVSQLQSAVAATAGAGRPSLLQASPGSGSAAGPNQPMNSLAGIGSGVLQGSQADLNKRGPVEFNHAISYVNKIKVSTIRASPIRGPVILTYYIYPTESVCQRSRDLQAVSRDLADLSAGI